MLNHRKFDYRITGFDWPALIQWNPPDKVCGKVCEKLEIFENLSQRNIINKRRKNYSWLNSGVTRAMAYRDWLWTRHKRTPKNQALASDYRVERNRVVALICITKRRYFLQKFDQSARKAAKTWSLINHLRGKDKNCFTIMNHFAGNPTAVADEFDRYLARASESSSSV